MNTQQIFREFLNKIEEPEQKKFDQKLLLNMFLDLNRVLQFKSIPENELSELLNHMLGIRIHIALPEKKLRSSFFKAVNDAQIALAKLTSTHFEWGGINPDLRILLTEAEDKLTEIHKIKKDWGNGRNPEWSPWQIKGVIRLYRELKRSQQEVASKQHWKEFKIKQHGQFDFRKITSVDLNSEFEATPARLISNFAKGLRINLSELAIQHIVKKYT